MRKNVWMKSVGMACIMFAAIGNAVSQSSFNQIGPKGTDTSLFCKVYVMRENDELKGYYFGLLCDEIRGVFSKVDAGNAYLLHLWPNGERHFYVESMEGGKKTVTLDLFTGKTYYLKVVASGTMNRPEVDLQIMDEPSGKAMLATMKNRIHQRYSVIFPQFGSRFFSDRYAFEEETKWIQIDTIHVDLDKELVSQMRIPYYLDSYGPGPIGYGYGHGYHSGLTSFSYSEILLRSIYKRKKAPSNEESFLKPIEKRMKKFTKPNERFGDKNYEILCKGDLKGAMYSVLIYRESKDFGAPNMSGSEYLILREVLREMVMTAPNGKMYTVEFNYSQRGREDELCTKEELIERMKVMEQSFKLKMRVKKVE